MLQKDKAICLRKVDYSETSQIVTLFTRETGKVSAMAKGARRSRSSFDGPIEVFSCGPIVFSVKTSGQLCSLTEFEQQPRFLPLRRNLSALNCALLAAELLEALTQDLDPHSELFDAFAQFLQEVQSVQNARDAKQYLIQFQLALLEYVGLQPVLQACSNCGMRVTGKWKEYFFSSHHNGLLCPGCEQAFPEKRQISRKTAAALSDSRILLRAEPHTIDEVEDLLVYHFTHLLHRPPKMAKHLPRAGS